MSKEDIFEGNEKPHPTNYFVITEQGDLGLGSQQITDEEQEHVEEQKRYYRKQTVLEMHNHM